MTGSRVSLLSLRVGSLAVLALGLFAVLSLPALAKTKPAKLEKKEEVVQLYQSFVQEKALAARGEECIRSRQCPSDEYDLVRHIEQAYKLQKQLESLAKKGNNEAAYLAGLIAYEEGKRFLDQFHAYMEHLDSAYYRSARQLIEFSDREFAKAKALLLAPSKAMMPEACLLMGQVLEGARSAQERQASTTFFYCAAREWVLAGKTDLAMRAYQGMVRNGKPQDPMLIDIHARLFNQRPENPWRPMEKTASSDASQSNVNR